ncbi:MAG: hypothetical protein KC502_06925 [Myxococcales bacterium]|nr:hypothetical protein [Myxococcales bacterium]
MAQQHWIRKLVLGLLATLLALPSVASAAASDTIRLQGRLTTNGGGPAPDGDYGLTVSLYGNKTDTKALAEYVYVGVKLKNGIFTISVGKNGKLDTTNIVNGKVGWVGVKVGSDAELPRMAIHKVPYAISANVASSLKCTGCVKASQMDAAILTGVTKQINTVKTTLDTKFSKADAAHAGALKSLDTKLTAATGANKKAIAGLTTKVGTKADDAAISKVGKTGQYADLKNAPKPTLANQTCAVGKVVVGIDANGKVKCATDKTNALSTLDARFVNEKQGNSVTGAMVANSTLTGADIKNGSVGAAELTPCPTGQVLQSNGKAMVCTSVAKTQNASANLLHNPTFSDMNKDARPDAHSLRSTTSSAYYRYTKLSGADVAAMGGFGGKFSSPSMWATDLRSSNKSVDSSIILGTAVNERTSFGAWVTCSVWVRRPDTVGTNAIAQLECFGKKIKLTIKKGDLKWHRMVTTQRVTYPLASSARRMSIYGSGFATNGDPAYVRYALPKLEYGPSATAWNPGATSMPRGMIAFFAHQCPAGWAEYTALRGRVAIGSPSGGKIGQTRGTALGNNGARVITTVPRHTHSVNPPKTSSTSVGNHTHSHNHPSTKSNTTGNHRHYHDHPSTNTSTTGNHRHGIRTRQDDWNDSGGAGPSWGDGDNGAYKPYHYTDYAGNHAHSLNLGGIYSNYQGNHYHTTDLPNINSSAAGGHSHTTDIAPFNAAHTGSGSVEVTMPYVQLVACYVL